MTAKVIVHRQSIIIIWITYSVRRRNRIDTHANIDNSKNENNNNQNIQNSNEL